MNPTQKLRTYAIYSCIMGVKAGVIVNINGGDRGKRTYPLCHLLEQFSDITVSMFAAWPAAVVIELVVKSAQAVFCGTRVADQDRQGAG